MSDSNAKLEKALSFSLRWEGGYVNHPNDPGGATNKGVTQRVYDKHRRDEGSHEQGVRNISDAEVHKIYETGYWNKARCGQLISDLDIVQFDTAVNMGVGRAMRFLQQATQCTPVDGAWGPKTAAAAANCDPGVTLRHYCSLRENRYRHLSEVNPKLAVFLKGWLNRLNDLRGFVGLAGFESIAPGAAVDLGGAEFIMRLQDELYPGEEPV